MAMRMHLDKDQSGASLMAGVADLANEAQKYQDVPFEKIVEALEIEKDNSRHPIFQMMFGVQDFGEIDENSFFESVDCESHYAVSRFDMDVFFAVRDSQIHCRINYAKSLLRDSTIERFAKSMRQSLDFLCESPESPIGNCPMMDQEEQACIISSFNDTNFDWKHADVFMDLFADHAKNRAESIAVICGSAIELSRLG